MLEHIVLFRPNPHLSPEVKKGFIEAARAMKNEIPEILSITAGENWSGRGDGFELALSSRFLSKETLEVYQKHPHHQNFIQEWVRPHIEKVIAIDYFID